MGDLFHVFSESEIAYLKDSFSGQDHVARFEIAMIDAFVMSLRQTQGELMNNLQDLGLRDYVVLVRPKVAFEKISART